MWARRPPPRRYRPNLGADSDRIEHLTDRVYDAVMHTLADDLGIAARRRIARDAATLAHEYLVEELRAREVY
jgi:hypothetical protein